MKPSLPRLSNVLALFGRLLRLLRGRPLTFAASFSANCVRCYLRTDWMVAAWPVGRADARTDGTFSFVSNMGQTNGRFEAGESRRDLRTFVSVELSYPSGLMEGALFPSLIICLRYLRPRTGCTLLQAYRGVGCISGLQMFYLSHQKLLVSR